MSEDGKTQHWEELNLSLIKNFEFITKNTQNKSLWSPFPSLSGSESHVEEQVIKEPLDNAAFSIYKLKANLNG